MQTATSKDQLNQIVQSWKADGLRIGYVPTMGALHDGHLSLVKIAQDHADKVVVSIYVNPTQFAPGEDFEAYPRDIERDAAKLEATGVDTLYLPQQDELYPDGAKIDMDAGEAAKGLDSDFRPHFFHGVATVVRRLFDHVQPDVAVFGEKDYQQLMVIREMVGRLSLPIEIIGGPTMRDEHGLALASRNAYLEPHELPIARQLNKILKDATRTAPSPPRAEGWGEGEKLDGQTKNPHPNPLPQGGRDYVLEEAKQALLEAGFDKVDYIEKRWGRVLGAGWVGKTRLIDNVPA